jgi:predicted  nucleic acid-binding Zn-ribbon protein
MEDQSKFFNVIIDKTNQKLNSFQAQVIVLESQLQMAIEERDNYRRQVEELPALNFNITEFEDLKKEFNKVQDQLNTAQEQISTYETLVLSLENKNAELERQVNSGSSYLRDQNETLLQEIRRLKAEIASLSSK